MSVVEVDESRPSDYDEEESKCSEDQTKGIHLKPTMRPRGQLTMNLDGNKVVK